MSAFQKFLEALGGTVKRQGMSCVAPDNEDIGELQKLAWWTKYGRPIELKEKEGEGLATAGTLPWDVYPDE